MNGLGVPPERVRPQLERILASREFAGSARLSTFLRHVVECAVAGRSAEIKEYSIGVEVYGRGATFDPQTDSSVRVEASRLRAKLAKYYQSEGLADELQISIPKGRYVPLFVLREPPAAPPAIAATPESPTAARNPSARWPLYASVAGLLLIAAAALAVMRPWAPRPGPPPYLSPLTSYEGSEINPAFSPDGDKVAFAWNVKAANNFDIYIKQLGTGDPLRLTFDPANEFSPAWSPDGRQIAFLRQTSAREAEILVIPALGGSHRRVARIVYPLLSYYPRLQVLSWTMDGKWLLSASALDATLPVTSIVAFSVDGGEHRVLTTPPADSRGDSAAAISPDGKRIAFLRATSDLVAELYEAPISSELRLLSAPRQLTRLNLTIWNPVWSGDGKSLIFSRSEGRGVRRVWRLELGSGEMIPLPVATTGSTSIAISHRTQRLVTSVIDVDNNIWRIDLRHPHGDAPRRPFLTSTRGEENAQFSPDGTRVAFQSDLSGPSEIWICDRDGANSRQLTSLGQVLTVYPRWSPDGRNIVFHSRRTGHANLYVADAESGKVRQLTPGSNEDSTPSWSHDGLWIYYGSRHGSDFHIWKISASGGQPRQLTTRTGSIPFASRDGNSVFFASRVNEIWRVPVNGGTETKVLDDLAQPSLYTLTATSILYVRNADGGTQELTRFDLATGKRTRLARFDKELKLGLTLSPDGQTLLYSQADRNGSDLALIENFQ